MATKGIHRSPETEFKKGLIPWNKGKSGYKNNGPGTFTKEHREKLSKARAGKKPWNKGVIGAESHMWQGGKVKLGWRIRASWQNKKWRADVFRRDGWTCQTCGLRGHGKDIAAHHIIPFKEILNCVKIDGLNDEEKYLIAMQNPLFFDVSNGVTLCRDCHILTYTKKEKK